MINSSNQTRKQGLTKLCSQKNIILSFSHLKGQCTCRSYFPVFVPVYVPVPVSVLIPVPSLSLSVFPYIAGCNWQRIETLHIFHSAHSSEWCLGGKPSPRRQRVRPSPPLYLRYCLDAAHLFSIIFPLTALNGDGGGPAKKVHDWPPHPCICICVCIYCKYIHI
jgi:hypothetical protein